MPSTARSGGFDDLAPEEPYEGVLRRAFSSSGATVMEYVFEPGAKFPVHRHPQEQITLVREGELQLTVDDESTTLRAGDWAIIPPQVKHGIASLGAARFLVVLVPRRDQPDQYTIVE
jgi:unsaturated pyranuronate lyase